MNITINHTVWHVTSEAALRRLLRWANRTRRQG